MDAGINRFKLARLQSYLPSSSTFASSTGSPARMASALPARSGVVANMAPRLFAGMVAAVPLVDVLATMLDADLPLTPPEWLEWGNPIEDRRAFETIRGYSPYDNVLAQSYPPILALAGLTDPRVTYWEPAKWVARLWATMTSGGPILLKTQMSSGTTTRRAASTAAGDRRAVRLCARLLPKDPDAQHHVDTAEVVSLWSTAVATAALQASVLQAASLLS